MAKFTREDMKHVARLCRINCSDEEIEELSGDLGRILGYVDQLGEVDTDGVEPCNQVLADVKNVSRKDEVKMSITRDEFLANAPDQVAGMIRVPPVIKGKGK